MSAARIVCALVVALALARALTASAPASARRAEPARAAAPVASGAAAPRGPNVLLVSIDSLRRDHVGAYGYARDTTPTIDRLAREGARFAQAVSPSSWTLPVHMSLLTAMTPREHGVTKTHRALAREVETLPRVLRDRGWTTAGFVSTPLLSSRYGFAQGFDHYDDHSLPQNTRGAADRGATSPLSTRITLDWIDRWHAAGATRPFFVFLHLWDVHYDYAPPPPYDRLFDPDYAGAVTADGFLHSKDIHPGMDPRDLAHVLALYDGEIRYTDDHLGRIVDRLAALDVLDDTIVVVTSDHGDEFFDHGGKGHGLTVYDELIMVPLVVRYPPRVAPGQVIEPQVRLVDVAPTVLGLAGVAPPPGFGASRDLGARHRERDLSPWLTGTAGGEPFPELIATVESQMVFGHGTGGLRTRARKLIDYNVGRPSELYDLRTDPRERTNQAAAEPEMLARLARVRSGWSRRLEGVPSPSGPITLDADTAERLRAMGYVE